MRTISPRTSSAVTGAREGEPADGARRAHVESLWIDAQELRAGRALAEEALADPRERVGVVQVHVLGDRALALSPGRGREQPGVGLDPVDLAEPADPAHARRLDRPECEVAHREQLALLGEERQVALRGRRALGVRQRLRAAEQARAPGGL